MRGGEKGSSHPVPCQHGPCCAAERVIDKQVSAVKEKCCRALWSRLPDQYPAMAKPAADWLADDGCWGNKSPGINCLGDYYRMRCFAASRCLLKIYIPWVCIGGLSSCAAWRFRMVHTPCRCGARGVAVAVAVWGAPGVEEGRGAGGEACAVLLPPSWRGTGCQDGSRGAFLPGLGVAWLPLVCFEPSLVNLFPVLCRLWRRAGMARGGANLRGPAARGCLRLQHGSLLPAACSGAAG